MCQQLEAFQFLRVVLVRLSVVVALAIRPDLFEAGPALVPIVFVITVVVVALSAMPTLKKSGK